MADPDGTTSDAATGPAGGAAPAARAITLAALLGTATAVGLQVLLPRVFSVVLWYHLGFFAVSLGMLGFAAGGALVERRTARGGRWNPAGVALFAALSWVVAVTVVVHLPLEASGLIDSRGDRVRLVILGLVLAVPFSALGTLVCQALHDGREQLGRTYGLTFLGGALGAAGAVGVMQLAGLRRTAAVLAALPLLVALLAGRRWQRVLAGVLVLAAGGLFVEDDLWLSLESRKHFPRVPPSAVLAEADDATSHVLFYDNPDHHGLWPSVDTDPATLPETVGVAIDTWAITFLTAWDPHATGAAGTGAAGTDAAGTDAAGDNTLAADTPAATRTVIAANGEAYPAFIDEHQAGLAFVGAAPGFSSLIIGAGGGWDVLTALREGAGHVTAVELNPHIVDAVKGPWAEFTGHLYSDPRVEVHAAEGRHFAEHDERTYDRVVLAGVDTFASTQAGAMALAENDLYTIEAFDTWLERLAPGGVLCLTRWWFEPPRQTPRLVLTAAEGLRRAGIRDPGAHIVVGRGEQNSLTFVKRSEPFTDAERRELAAAFQQRNAALVYARGLPGHPLLSALLDVGGYEGWTLEGLAPVVEGYPYRIDPCTDDRPFFFETARLATLFRSEGDWIHDRLGGHEVLAATLAVLLVLVLPLLFAGGRATRQATGQAAGAPPESRGARARSLLPFLLLGFAYMFVEIPLLQRLTLVLGHPVYAVAVVLVALLVFSGLGSVLAGRQRTPRPATAMLLAAVTIPAVLLGLHALLVPVISGWPLWPRIGGVLLLLAAPALVMGACFPLAVRRLGVERVPSAFLWNGLASVLAGPLAVLVALEVGFTATLLTGAGAYLLAAACLVTAKATTGNTAGDPVETGFPA